MWIIFNKYIPVGKFWMMTLWFMIFVREDKHGREVPERVKRHERRHWHQVLQIMITSFALFLTTWLIYDYNPWWWLLWVTSYLCRVRGVLVDRNLLASVQYDVQEHLLRNRVPVYAG